MSAGASAIDLRHQGSARHPVPSMPRAGRGSLSLLRQGLQTAAESGASGRPDGFRSAICARLLAVGQHRGFAAEPAPEPAAQLSGKTRRRRTPPAAASLTPHAEAITPLRELGEERRKGREYGGGEAKRRAERSRRGKQATALPGSHAAGQPAAQQAAPGAAAAGGAAASWAPAQPSSDAAPLAAAAAMLVEDGADDVASAEDPSEAAEAAAIQEVYRNEPPPDVCIVDTAEAARAVAAQLLAPDMRDGQVVFACDTEVMDIDVSSHSPCCHGRVICFSIYAGDEFHWGPEASFDAARCRLQEAGSAGARCTRQLLPCCSGPTFLLLRPRFPLPLPPLLVQPPAPGQPNRSMLWVDTWLGGDEGRAAEAAAIAEAFRPFWESTDHPKACRRGAQRCWGACCCKGLWCRREAGWRGRAVLVWHNYSFDRHVLERMGLRMRGFGADTMHMARLWDSSRIGRGGYSLEALSSDPGLMGDGTEAGADAIRGKVSMKKLFGRPNIKADGTPGKARGRRRRGARLMILPAVEELQRDPETKWKWVNYSAYDAKSTLLLYSALRWELEATAVQPDPHVVADYETAGVRVESMWDVYCHFWRPFGELLTDMEATGMAVDREHLAAAQRQAEADQAQAQETFRRWATARVPDAQYMNVGSGPQVLQLLFGGAKNKNADKPPVPLERVFKARAVPNQVGVLLGEKRAKKNMDITLHNVWDRGRPSPLEAQVFTPSGAPACSTPVLRGLAGKSGRASQRLVELGLQQTAADFSDVVEAADALEHGGGDPGAPEAAGGGEAWPTDDAEIAQRQQVMQAQEELEDIGKREGLGRLFPLFGSVAEGLRACEAVGALVDASAIDTLLSNFIVPLQSDAISKPDAAGSMIAAFELGGDFHSRTALGMYDHIKEAIGRGKCLLEAGEGVDPSVPLLKDKFASERRKAKVLNFSIAYGKTAHGLSKDWGVSLAEAEDTVSRWYSDRPEASRQLAGIKRWQEEQRAMAVSRGYVQTVLGRRRQLPDATSKSRAAQAHALRAAINTPIQARFARRLQRAVHDEVILEGPRETAPRARDLVVACMRSPFSGVTAQPLRVDLVVDSKYADTWYDAK
eukprot:scaffold4.g5000.t1